MLRLNSIWLLLGWSKPNLNYVSWHYNCKRMCNVYSWKVERSKVGDYSYLEINPEDSFATAATLGVRGRHYSFPQSHSYIWTIDEWKVESTLPFWKDVKINFLLQENVIEGWFTWTHGHTSTKQLVNYLSCIHCPSLQRTHLIHDIWDQCSLHQTSTISGANDGGTYSVTIWIQGEMQRAMHLKNWMEYQKK